MKTTWELLLLAMRSDVPVCILTADSWHAGRVKGLPLLERVTHCEPWVTLDGGRNIELWEIRGLYINGEAYTLMGS